VIVDLPYPARRTAALMANCFKYRHLKTVRVPLRCLASLILAMAVGTAQAADFDASVALIFASHCLDCHSGHEPKGGLDLSQVESTMQGGDSGESIAVNDASASLLWERIDSDEMPPEHPLSDDEKNVIRHWIDNGAKWGTSPIDPFAITTTSRAGYDWWSLQPLQSVQPPQIEPSDWAHNEVDLFVLKKLRDAQLEPSPQANPRSLIRRLHFDLNGLPPSPEAVAGFVADPSEKAYGQLVDDLLASQHYGERWGRHWLDVVRFGESDGFERNTPRMNAWPYRDWVIKALNDDLPYDEFVRRQLIGDQLLGGVEGAAATGFWVAGVHNTVVGGSKRMKQLARQDELEEVLATVGQTFLGLTVNCARCHDHKFDPITQKEFYQLASSISGLGYGERTEKSPGAAATLDEINTQLSRLQKQLAVINGQVRQEIIASRLEGETKAAAPPQAFALWEFDSDLRDSRGSLHGTAHGNARLDNGALVVDGKSFVSTAAIGQDITEKTLEVWVQLDNLNQRGGGAITIGNLNGGVFDSIVFGERESQLWMPGSNGFVRTSSFKGPQEDLATQRPVHVAIVYQADGTITGYRDGIAYGQPVRRAALQKYSAGAADIIFGLRHQPAGGNRFLTGRIHKAALYDRALVPEEVAASAGNSAEYVSEKQITNWLSEDRPNQRTELQARITQMTTDRNRQAAIANQKIYTLTAGAGTSTNVLLRGDPDNVGDLVAPAAVAAVSGVKADFDLAPDAPEADRRRRLAEWISDTANPLFSRVIANRIWHYHFGTGIVDTPNDLGFNGGRPSHPQLLEWLAARLRDDGFRMKALHRMLVMSSTYRQAAFPEESDSTSLRGSEVDANNRLLWRMTPRRLEAESIRDGMLSIAGKLNPQLGGDSFVDVSVVENNGTTYYEPITVDGDDFFRRTVYRFNPRGGRSALLDTFDCPDPANAAPRRAVTTTPLQALSLLNNSFVLQMSDYFAARIESDIGDSVAEQVTRAWQLAVMREPTTAEHRLSVELVDQHGLSALCRGLFNTTEFVLID
jgi:hypothetical protein